MTFSKLKTTAMAATMVLASTGIVLAQSNGMGSSAPSSGGTMGSGTSMPTGSAGNSNTGPGAKPMGTTGSTGSTMSPSAAPMGSSAPMPSGSAGNSNTGPGATAPMK